MKKQIAITVDSEDFDEFDRILKKNMICRSTMFNYLMKNELTRMKRSD